MSTYLKVLIFEESNPPVAIVDKRIALENAQRATFTVRKEVQIKYDEPEREPEFDPCSALSPWPHSAG